MQGFPCSSHNQLTMCSKIKCEVSDTLSDEFDDDSTYKHRLITIIPITVIILFILKTITNNHTKIQT